LQSVFARHRDKWADLLLRTALWMREAPLELDLCWRELAIVAKALADGRDMGEIGLMREIAQRTLAILANDGRMWSSGSANILMTSLAFIFAFGLLGKFDD
jgi:hypothetical protein